MQARKLLILAGAVLVTGFELFAIVALTAHAKRAAGQMLAAPPGSAPIPLLPAIRVTPDPAGSGSVADRAVLSAAGTVGESESLRRFAMPYYSFAGSNHRREG